MTSHEQEKPKDSSSSSDKPSNNVIEPFLEPFPLNHTQVPWLPSGIFYNPPLRDEISRIEKDNLEYRGAYGTSATPYHGHGEVSNATTNLSRIYGGSPTWLPQHTSVLRLPSGELEYLVGQVHEQPVTFLPQNLASPQYASSASQNSENSTSGQFSDIDLSGNGQVRTRDPSTLTEAHRLDKSYRVHHARSFKVGKIFKVLWSEPSGAGTASRSVREENLVNIDRREFHSKVRRFLIVRQWDGHCSCLALNTYGGQGTTKHGVHAKYHAVIYENKPSVAPGEQLYLPPIRFVPNGPRDKLASMTRINYAKIYTVEYNVKVCFIGAIHKGSAPDLIQTYNSVHTPLSMPTSHTVESTEKTLTSRNEPGYDGGIGPSPHSFSGGYNFAPSYSSSFSIQPTGSHNNSTYAYSPAVPYEYSTTSSKLTHPDTSANTDRSAERYSGTDYMSEYFPGAVNSPLPIVLTKPKEVKEEPAQLTAK